MHLRGLSFWKKKKNKTLEFQLFNNIQEQGDISAEKFSFSLDVTVLAHFLEALPSWLHSRFEILCPSNRGIFGLFLQFLN